MKKFSYRKILFYLFSLSLITGCSVGDIGNQTPTVKYTLTISVNGQGYTNPVSGAQYRSGRIVNLYCIPDTHWSFLSWEGANSNDIFREAGYWKIKMDSNKTITANFAPIKYNLTVNISGQGTVNQELQLNAQDLYIEDDVVNLFAIPDPQWEFLQWEGDLNSTFNPNAIRMDADKTVTAVFIPRVETPEISPAQGFYYANQTFSISCATPGTIIKYTTDNSVPSRTHGLQYSDPFTLPRAINYYLKAIAYKDGMADSKIKEETYTLYWNTIGNPGFTTGRADYISLAVNNNTPYIAYSEHGEYDIGGKAIVMKYNGATWVPVGSPYISPGAVFDIPLVFYNNTPYVAFADGAHGWKASVMKYDGANWVLVGNPNFSANSASWLAFAIDQNNGTPYLAYRDSTNESDRLTVMKLNGGNWVPVGSPCFSADNACYISLAIDNSTPYVVYSESNNSGKATALKYDGLNWVPVGDSAGFSAGSACNIDLAFNNGTPYVAYTDLENGEKITVMKYNGNNWETVGVPGLSAGNAYYPSLAFWNGIPYLGYEDFYYCMQARIMMFNGSEWGDIGLVNLSPSMSCYISLAICNGNPYIAYSDGAYDFKATVATP
ncbi:MAG TPA: chitobiase/beta-hexosaminidase C-terminal domain-containing protein [Bacillota bacterium]|nr:chitobiase/beta-hexosaminidase C-terminal domain-containing protein [Bacillota bacterium]